MSNNKGLSLLGMNVSVPALSEKDVADLEFALGLGVDWVALSFENLCRGHYELGHDPELGRRLEAIFTKLGLAIRNWVATAAESFQPSLTQQRRPIHIARKISTVAHPPLASGPRLPRRRRHGRQAASPGITTRRSTLLLRPSTEERDMTQTREAASAVAATPRTTTAVTPNLFTFSGRRDDTQVTFSTTSITGQPQFSYHDDTRDVSASGDDITVERTALGTWSPSPWRRCPTCTP